MRGLLLSLVVFTLGAPLCLAGENPTSEKPREKPKKGQPNAPRPGLVNPEAVLKQLDKNKDGVLTKDELPPRLAERFDKLDANGDGKIDKTELEKALRALARGPGQPGSTPEKRPDAGKIVERILERLDTNKDGKISKDEAQGPLAQGFDRLDTNKDGFLDKEELARVAARLAEAQGARPGDRPRPPAGAQDFDSLDKNADGRLTPDEVKGTPLAEKFEQIDANKDGKIDPREWKTFQQKQASK